MARFDVGGGVGAAVAAVVAVVAVATVSAGSDETKVGVAGDRGNNHTSVTRRRQVQPLIYHVDEQMPIGSIVGDLRNDIRSACDEDRRRADCDIVPTRFSVLSQRPSDAAQLFGVHEATGVLRSAGVVDREEICFRWNAVCSVVLEVAVHYSAGEAFDVAVVEVIATYCCIAFAPERLNLIEINFHVWHTLNGLLTLTA